MHAVWSVNRFNVSGISALVGYVLITLHHIWSKLQHSALCWSMQHLFSDRRTITRYSAFCFFVLFTYWSMWEVYVSVLTFCSCTQYLNSWYVHSECFIAPMILKVYFGALWPVYIEGSMHGRQLWGYVCTFGIHTSCPPLIGCRGAFMNSLCIE